MRDEKIFEMVKTIVKHHSGVGEFDQYSELVFGDLTMQYFPEDHMLNSRDTVKVFVDREILFMYDNDNGLWGNSLDSHYLGVILDLYGNIPVEVKL